MCLVAGALALSSLVASSSDAALITNGDFQTGPAAGQSFAPASTAITGWTVIGGGGVERFNGNFGFPTWNVQLNPSPTAAFGGVRQTTNLITEVGVVYQIDIDFGARAEGADRGAKAVLTFGGQTFTLTDFTGTNNTSVYTHYTLLTAPAASTSTLFSVVAASPYVDAATTWKGVIDNVVVVAVPEPVSLGLLAVGGLTMLRPRRSVRA